LNLVALVRISDDNANRLSLALDELDAHYREHKSTIKPTKEDILAGGHLLLLTRAGPLDVLGFIGDKERYEDLVHVSSEVAMTIGRFRVLDLEELIRQKKATDRPKDRAALVLLEEALRHNRQKD
jgi:hypothetical protein